MPLAPEPSDPAGSAPVAAVGPRVYGVVDVVRPDRIAGWAIDRADSDAVLEIDIHREGRLFATVRADRPRKDLERGSVGTGRYGFTCELAPPIEPGFEFTVSAMARTPDGINCELKRIGPAAGPAEAERRIVERIYEAVTRPAAEPAPRDPAEKLPEVVQRLELAQARIEAALGAIDPPAPPGLMGIRILLGVSLAVGIGSLALGLVSMWQP